MNEASFSTLYKTFDTDKLLDIIDNPNDYQPLAVKAARLVLDERQLSTAELEMAKEIQLERQRADAKKRHRMKLLSDKFKLKTAVVVDVLNPIKEEALTADKSVSVISAFLGGLSIFLFYKEAGMIKFMLTNASFKWDFEMVVYLLPLLIAPLAAFLLWFRKRNGWFLSAFFFSYVTTGIISSLFLRLYIKGEGISISHMVFPDLSPMSYLLSFVLFGGMLWTLTKEKITGIFNIDRTTTVLTISIGVITSILIKIYI